MAACLGNGAPAGNKYIRPVMPRCPISKTVFASAPLHSVNKRNLPRRDNWRNLASRNVRPNCRAEVRPSNLSLRTCTPRMVLPCSNGLKWRTSTSTSGNSGTADGNGFERIEKTKCYRNACWSPDFHVSRTTFHVFVSSPSRRFGPQQINDLLISSLGESFIITADRVKLRIGPQDADLIGNSFQAFDSTGRADRCGHNDLCGLLFLCRQHCGFSCRTSGKAIIDEQHGLTGQVEWLLAKSRLIGIQPFFFLLDDLVELRPNQRISP